MENIKNKGGRPRGRRNDKTLKLEKVLKQTEQMVLRKNEELFRAAMIPAMGCVFVFKMEDEVTGKGPKGGEYKKRKHVLVRDPHEIAEALDMISEYGGKDPSDEDSPYYYITVEKPDYRAIDMLWDRGLGRVMEKADVTVHEEFSLKKLAERRKKLDKGS